MVPVVSPPSTRFAVLDRMNQARERAAERRVGERALGRETQKTQRRVAGLDDRGLMRVSTMVAWVQGKRRLIGPKGF